MQQSADLEYFGDEELLAKYRAERQASNDQWQFNQLVEHHKGAWSGIWSDFVPVDDPTKPLAEGRRKAQFKLVSIHRGKQSFWVSDEERALGWTDEVIAQDFSGRLSDPVEVDKADYSPHDLRAPLGSMAVGVAFTRCKAAVADNGDDLLAPEIWLADGSTRVRCRLIYGAQGSNAPYIVRKLVVMKERAGVSDLTCEEPALWGSEGHKIYDTVNIRPGDWRFVTSGRLALSFPPVLARDEPGTFIVDWKAGQMRYQADRKFKVPDGSLDALELTEIMAEDSEIYKPVK